MIKDNGDGTFTVKLPGAKQAHTVDPKTGATFTSDGNWAAILELALIAEIGEWAKRDSGISTDRYASAIVFLTGDEPVCNRNASRVGFGTFRENTLDKVKRANDGYVVIVGTGLREPKGDAKTVLQENHTYAVLGYDDKTGRIRMRNPHGSHASIPAARTEAGWGTGEFWLTLDEYKENFLGMAYSK